LSVTCSSYQHHEPFVPNEQSVSQSAVWYDMVRYTLEQRVFLYVTYVKYGSAVKCRRKFRDERVPSRQTIHIC
jgi:hypothetical protein